MKTLAAAMILAASLTAPATAHADPIQATGIGECIKAARLYRINPDTVIPPGCVDRGGFKGLLGPPGDNPPPPDDAGDVPPPPQP